MEEKLWYAVQYEDDFDWGYGSYDLDTAVKMLMSCDKYVRIAVIENDNCINEIYKSEIKESEIKKKNEL